MNHLKRQPVRLPYQRIGGIQETTGGSRMCSKTLLKNLNVKRESERVMTANLGCTMFVLKMPV